MKSFLFFLCSLHAVLGISQYREYEWAERDTWMQVDELFGLAEIEADDIVADIGCHEGYLSMHLARRVGESGKVYAVDVINYRLEALKSNAADLNIENITTVLGDYDDPKLPTGIFDAVFVIDTYHEMDAHETILMHVKRALKSDGKLVLLEKLKERMRGKTRKEQVDAHTLSPKYVKRELKKAGFTVIREVPDFGDWENDKSKQMWFLIAMKGEDEK